MREAAGQTLKSSLSHTWIRDTRNDKYMATHGFMTKFFQEFAGLGGQAHFYKAEVCGQYSWTLFPGIVSVHHLVVMDFVNSNWGCF